MGEVVVISNAKGWRGAPVDKPLPRIDPQVIEVTEAILNAAQGKQLAVVLEALCLTAKSVLVSSQPHIEEDVFLDIKEDFREDMSDSINDV